MLSPVNHARGRVFALICASLSATLWPMGAPFAQPSAEIKAKELIEKVDEVRFPKGGFETEVRIVSNKPNEEPEERLYKVLARGADNSIVQVLEPAADKGQSILMKGRELWLYVPDVSQPIRLTLSQRLTGQVANGDLARANFSADYEAVFVKNETVENIEHALLELTAKEKSVAYAKVMLWVNPKNAHPHKAEFYSVSGRLLKTVQYQNFKTLLGRLRPTRLVLTDAVKKGEESVLEYNAMKNRELADRMFTKENLRRLD
jgi:outer membrane lipoprotein-sorting protein